MNQKVNGKPKKDIDIIKYNGTIITYEDSNIYIKNELGKTLQILSGHNDDITRYFNFKRWKKTFFIFL